MPERKPERKEDEALYGEPHQPRDVHNVASQAFLELFISKKVAYEEMKAERDMLIVEGGESEKISQLSRKMKQLRETMRSIKREARMIQPNADLLTEKTSARHKQYDLAIKNIQNTLESAKDENRRARLRKQLERAEAGKNKVQASVKESSRLCGHDSHIQLAEQPYKPHRALTLQEKRIDFKALNDIYNDLQGDLENELERITSEETARVAQTVENKLDAGDIAAIAALTFLFRGKIRKAIKAVIGRSFGVGKDAAAKELGINTPATPLLDTQIMALESHEIAEAYADAVENVAKSAVVAGMAARATKPAIVGHMKKAVSDEASRAIINTSGTVVGQHVNRGRGSVLFNNAARIVSFQRSEVLDSVTCPMCLALDGRIVSSDDPAARMDIVHTHCRGLWVPVFEADEVQPEVTGIPKSVMNNFETVDGRPVVNAFRQLKKPVGTTSEKARDLIRKRLQKA